MENVSSVGNFPEGAGNDEAGREVGETCEILKAKVVSYTTNMTEQTGGGQKDMSVPMVVDHVGGSEPEEEDWEDVDEVRRGSMCYSCGMMRDLARDCGSKGKTKVNGGGRGGGGGKGYATGKGKAQGKKVQANLEDLSECILEN